MHGSTLTVTATATESSKCPVQPASTLTAYSTMHGSTLTVTATPTETPNCPVSPASTITQYATVTGPTVYSSAPGKTEWETKTISEEITTTMTSTQAPQTKTEYSTIPAGPPQTITKVSTAPAQTEYKTSTMTEVRSEVVCVWTPESIANACLSIFRR